MQTDESRTRKDWMEFLVGIIAIYLVYKLLTKGSASKKTSGGCKYCGGSLTKEPRKGYSYACSGCGTDFP
jgi:hypothetical protein